MSKISTPFILPFLLLNIVLMTSSYGDTLSTIVATQVIVYQPAVSKTLSKKAGTCWTSSIAAPNRPDAWRCNVGNEIADPCFVHQKNKTLVCEANPAKNDPGFLLQLTGPLPVREKAMLTPTKAWGWLLQLADGSTCAPMQGTLPILHNTDKRATYGCDDRTVVFEDLQTGALWRAEKARLIPSGEMGSDAEAVNWIPIVKVWQ